MAYCTTAKLFLRFQSRIVPKAATTNPIARICPNLSRFYSTFSSSTPKPAPFSSCYRRIMNARTTLQSPFLGFSKRHYHGFVEGAVDPDTAWSLVLAGFVSFVAAGCLVFGRFETIPYSKRTHFVVLRPNWEKKLGAYGLDRMKEKELKDRILPDIHPQTIRVRAIANDLIGALKRNLEQDYDEVMPPEANKAVEISSRDNVVRDGMCIKNTKSMKKKKGERRGAVSHLEGLEWEILVVDQPIVNAYCLPGGKIVVFTGSLNHIKSNAELATIVGHEVGHAVARHTAEALTNSIWLIIFRIAFLLIVGSFLMVDGKDNSKIVEGLWNISKVMELPFSRKMETEADYIGLLLLASAGYDPMVAPGMYKKMSEISGGSTKWDDYLSTHPSGETRAENLSQAKVMEEALSIYRDVKQGLKVKGFF